MASGEKTKLLICRYIVNKNGSDAIDEDMSFKALINPSEITHKTSICYTKDKPFGSAATNPKFASTGTDTVDFSIVLDGTGILSDSGRNPVSVKSLLAKLNSVVYDYVGTQHQPSHVKILWGSLIFNCRLTSMSTLYTLFKPSGEPLRAKVTLGFIGAMSQKEIALMSNKSSPDLTHSVVVRQGDTLPLLCQRIYGDPGYYLDVAAFNGLSSFRSLQAGSQLYFPPLE